MRGMEMEEKNLRGREIGKTRGRGIETRKGERERERATERDGDLGSAYRSGRVTCVPEVGVLAWTNRRATPLSLPLPLFLSLSSSTSLLIPLAHLHCRLSSHSLLPIASSFLSRHAQIRTQQARTHARMHTYTHVHHHLQYVYTCLPDYVG